MVGPARQTGRAVEAVRHALRGSPDRLRIERAPPGRFERGRASNFRAQRQYEAAGGAGSIVSLTDSIS